MISNNYDLVGSINHAPGHFATGGHDHLDTAQMISMPQRPLDESSYSGLLCTTASDSNAFRASARPGEPGRLPQRVHPFSAVQHSPSEEAQSGHSGSAPLLVPRSLEEVCAPLVFGSIPTDVSVSYPSILHLTMSAFCLRNASLRLCVLEHKPRSIEPFIW